VTLRTARLGDICDINPKMPKSLDDGELVSFLPMAAVSEEGRIAFEEERTVAEVKKGYTYFERGDVLVAKITPCFENGKASRTISLSKPFGFGSTEFHVLRAANDVVADFLFYKIWNSSFRELGAQNMTGSAGQKRIPVDFLKRLEIDLPSIEEQRRISAILDKADALRHKRKRALDLLQKLDQSIFLETFGEASENPHGFPPCKLSDLCEFRGGSQPPKSTFSYEPGLGKTRLIQIRDYKTDEYATYIPKDLAKRPCSKSDVMIGRYGPPLFQILKGLEGSYNVALIKAEPKPRISREFLFHLLSSPKLQADVISQSERSAGQTGVNLKFLNAYPAYFPPESLQVAFKKIVNRQESVRAQSNMATLLADEVFASAQSRAFSGQL
jgi:type I restriction enzyme, S subunit